MFYDKCRQIFSRCNIFIKCFLRIRSYPTLATIGRINATVYTIQMLFPVYPNGRQYLYCLPEILEIICRSPSLRTSSPAHYYPCGKPSSCIQADIHSDSTKTESGGVHPQGSCRAVSCTTC